MSTVKLNLGQLNITGALVGVFSALISGFGGGFAVGAGAAVTAGMPLGKALIAGAVAGGAAAVTSAGNNVSGFLTQRTKDANGNAPVFPSLTSTDTADIGAAATARIMRAQAVTASVSSPVVDPALVALRDALKVYEDPILASIGTIIDDRQQAKKAQSNADRLAQLRTEVARLESLGIPNATPATAGASTEAAV